VTRRLFKLIKLLLEAVAGLAAVTAVLAGVLLWRLSSGPMEAEFLTPWIEQALNGLHDGMTVTVGGTRLIWAHGTVEMRASDMAVYGPSGARLALVPEAAVGLSLPALSHGEIAPSSIEAVGPSLAITRMADGHLDIGFSGEAPAESGEGGMRRIVADMLAGLSGEAPRDGSSFGPAMRHLRRIGVSRGTLGFNDLATGLSWRLDPVSLSLTRGADGLDGALSGELAQGPDGPVSISGGFRLVPGSARIPATLSAQGLNPSRLAGLDERLRFLSGLDIPVSARLELSFDRGFGLSGAEGSLIAGAGRVSLPALFDEPADMDYGQALLRYDRAEDSLALEDILIDTGEPTLTGRLYLARGVSGLNLLFDAAVEKVPVGELAKYWPIPLSPRSREWVLKNIRQGIADRATVSLTARIDPPEEEGGLFGKSHLRSLSGEMDYSGLSVSWIEGQPDFEQASGHGTYDLEGMRLGVSGARLGNGISISGGSVELSGMHEHASRADITLDCGGQLSTLAEILDGPHLRLFSGSDLPLEGMSGRMEGRVKLGFPLGHALTVEDVRAEAQGRLSGVSLPAGLAEPPVTDGSFSLSLTPDRLELDGNARILGMATALTWTERFHPRADSPRRELAAEAPVSEADRAAFGLTGPALRGLEISGPSPAQLSWRLMPDGLALAEAHIDFSGASLSVPKLGEIKPAGTGSKLDFRLAWPKDGAPQIPEFSYAADNGDVMRGLLRLRREEGGGIALDSAELHPLRLRGNDVSAGLSRRDGGGWKLVLSGDRLDLSAFAPGEDEGEFDPLAPPFPVDLDLDLAHLSLWKGFALDTLRLKALYDGRWWPHVEGTAISDAGEWRLLFLPDAGGDVFYADFADAGAALNLFSERARLSGGRMRLSGRANAPGPPLDLTGRIEIGPHRIRHAPLLAQVLNAVSLIGIAQSLGGEGIGFQRLVADWRWHDGMISISDGRDSGPSIGFTVEGTWYRRDKTLDLAGTVVPIYTVNRVLGAIPIFGTILSGGGGDMFAATYRIHGSVDRPEISVNPLAALAPGIIRHIFFVGEDESDVVRPPR
jgi:hypothetical protein